MKIKLEVGSVGIEIEGDELKLATAMKAAVATVSLFIEHSRPDPKEFSPGTGFQLDRRGTYELDGTDAGLTPFLG